MTLAKHGADSGVRVLSLDGSGAGALSELLILERIMYRTQVEAHLDTEPYPCDHFELIGGSGTGGIIALMLGRLRMSVKDAISAYETLRPQSKIGAAERFKTGSFEEALKKIFKQEQMNDMRPDACKTFVCAMNERNMNAGISHLFRSYDTLDEPASNCMIWEAARATSATPELLKPMEIGRAGMKQRYIDGGVGNNNPTSLVLREAHRIYPSKCIILVASIGAGHPDTIQIPKPRRLNSIANAMKNIAMDCENTHEDNAGRFRDIPNTYFRFNVEQGMQALEPKHWNKFSEVQAHTDAYLRMEDTKLKLAAAVKVILNPVVPVSELPVHPRVCPPPTFRFTGRRDILQHMSEYYNTSVGGRHVFLLYGLGGAGKSQIAFKFVEISDFPEPRFSDIYFIDSSTRQTIENDLAMLALAKQIGKSAKDSLLWLSHQHKEWLIIFNNADDIHLNLGEFFPSGSRGNILITSRNPALRQHAQVQCKVDSMELKDATELLLTAAGCDASILEYREIAKQIVQVFILCS
ncbi:acyl transferase/acyl hydrolase/lysophospholipase [Mycena epipterygia]|nr:acyl transferase/acyl hydrolase/lysophospholipase [Mycena epipterygia]